MRSRILMLLAILLLTFSPKTSAENYDGWEFDLELPAVKLVDAVNNSGGFDHRVYYSKLDNTNALVIVCHGYHDTNGNYGVIINNGYHYDYINAISQAIGWWIRKGELNCGPFNGVILVTCHTGFAPSVSHIPTLDMNLVMINNYKGQNGVVEDVDRFGNRVIKIFRKIESSPYALGVENTSSSPRKRRATREEVAQMYVP